MPLRICLISYLISKRATGLSSYLSTIVERLLDSGHAVTVLAADLEYGGAGASEAITLDRRARQITFSVQGRLNRRLYRCPELAHYLREHAGEFDLVDIQGMWALVNFDAARVARRRGLPVIITPHGMLTRWDWSKRRPFKDLLYAWQGRAMLDGAAAIRMLAVGERDATAVQLRAPVCIIANAVTPYAGELHDDPRQAVRARLGVPAGTPVVLFLGRISYQKGALEVVEAVIRSQSGVHLAVIGTADQDPAYAETVTARVGASGGRVHLLGQLFGEDKFVFLRGSDLFVTLSRNEGLSLAALEALAEGLPVILTANANLPEASSYDAGRIVACDSEMAAAAMDAIFADPVQLAAMRDNARRLYRERFSWEVVLPQLEALYTGVARTCKYAQDRIERKDT